MTDHGTAPARSRARRTVAWRAVPAVVLLAAVVVIVVTASRQRSTTPPRPGVFDPVAQWHTFTATRVPFAVEYPDVWHVYPAEFTSSFAEGLVYFSSHQVPDPCTTTHGGSDIDCGPPTVPLLDGDVVIEWNLTANVPGRPRPINHQPGRATTIDGHAAKISISDPLGRSICIPDHATRQIDVDIARQSGLVQMTACVSGTAADIEQITDAVVTSAHTVHLSR